MKKLIALITLAILLLSVSACSQSSTEGTLVAEQSAQMAASLNKEEVKFQKPISGIEAATGFDEFPGHTGTDFKGNKGDSVYASADGVVTQSVNGYVGYGKYIKVDHGNGYETVYAHCDELLAEVGDEVKAGDKIALVGETGRVTGSHLHFEVIKGNKARRC